MRNLGSCTPSPPPKKKTVEGLTKNMASEKKICKGIHPASGKELIIKNYRLWSEGGNCLAPYEL
jgi:hypothetical protein